MSKFSIIPARALFDTRLDQEDILLLVVLCQYTDKSGKCWPAFETISETFSPLVGRSKSYSKASISARMDRLESAGYVRDGGHRKNAIGGYGTKDWYVLHDGEIPAEFDRSQQPESNTSVQKTPPELNTSGQETPIVSERNDPCLTINNNNNRWHEELNQLTGGYMGGAEEFKDLTDAWQRFPDEIRHKEAMRQTSQARSRTVRVYLKAFLTFNPDYVPPPPKPTYSARARPGNARAPAPYVPPTEAERDAYRKRIAERNAALPPIGAVT